MSNNGLIVTVLVTFVALISGGTLWFLNQEQEPANNRIVIQAPFNPMPTATAQKPTAETIINQQNPQVVPLTQPEQRLSAPISMDMVVSRLPVGSVIRLRDDLHLTGGGFSFGVLSSGALSYVPVNIYGYIVSYEPQEQGVILRNTRLTVTNVIWNRSTTAENKHNVDCTLELVTDGGFKFALGVSGGTKIYIGQDAQKNYVIVGQNLHAPTIKESAPLFEVLYVPGPRIIKY